MMMPIVVTRARYEQNTPRGKVEKRDRTMWKKVEGREKTKETKSDENVVCSRGRPATVKAVLVS